jgi:hypothetical protein
MNKDAVHNETKSLQLGRLQTDHIGAILLKTVLWIHTLIRIRIWIQGL